MTKKLLEIEREIFLMGYYKAFMFNQTCCCICDKCTGSRNECINKKNSRPSPEGFAVDVYETVRRAGMEINVLSENPSEMHRIAIMLIE
jgi:predicted metal-binding protein